MYLNWNQKTISDFSEENINSLYNEGYVFVRTEKGEMNQTRSLRIDLDKFELSSENRRILRKTKDLRLKTCGIPYSEYHWSIGKMAKDFYETKFGEGTFSANKVREILTTEHNFNKLFVYLSLRANEMSEAIPHREIASSPSAPRNDAGYAICYESNEIIHYSYPFYNLNSEISNLGMSMMLQAINYAKENNKKYIYLGSAKDEKAKYKIQFTGLEWFDGEGWNEDLEKLKKVIS